MGVGVILLAINLLQDIKKGREPEVKCYEIEASWPVSLAHVLASAVQLST